MAIPIWKVEEALRKNGGFMSKAAVALGISQSAVWQRVSRNKKLKRAIEEIQVKNLDLAESNLIKGLERGEWEQTKFFLKCRGKIRGYIEHPTTAPQVSEEKPTPVKIEFTAIDGRVKPEEELKRTK